MEINQPKSVELKIMRWCKLAKAVKEKKKAYMRTCVSLSKFLLPPIPSSPLKIPPLIFIAQVSTAFRGNDNLLQLSFKSSERPRLGTSAVN